MIVMIAENINGTSNPTCSCGSWLDHWKNHSDQSAVSCVEHACRRVPEVGAHVMKSDSFDRRWYIVPLCSAHNAQTGKSLELIDSVVLVSANVALTCGR